jgi:predicted  nucleic acid-binding Zn-ribbon protein
MLRLKVSDPAFQARIAGEDREFGVGKGTMDRSLQEHLKRLHQLHQQLNEVQQELDRGPKLIKSRQAATQQKQADLDAQRERTTQLRMAADRKSLQLKTNEARMQELRTKLNQASSNREFDVLRTQIDADKMANSVLEDEILESLEQVDAGQIAGKRMEQELVACKVEEGKAAEKVAAAEAGLRARAADLQSQMAESEAHLPPDVVGAYRRMVQAYGAGALAEVNNKVCSFCYVQLPAQMVLQLKSGQLLFCKTCGRLLYPGDDE